MTYQELISTDDIGETVPSKVNENARTERFLNGAGQAVSFTVWADDATGSPKDIYLVTTAASALVATLPDPTAGGDAANGRTVTIMKVDAGGGTVTITPDDPARTINGATTVVLSTQYHYRKLVSNGAVWLVIGSS